MVVPEAIKTYLAENYGDGTCITSGTENAVISACMFDNLVEPLPSGYIKDDICKDEVWTWCYNNVGWCKTVEETGSISCTSTPPTGVTVSVAGKTGTAPCTITDVPTGSQTVTYSKTGYYSCTDVVTVVKDTTVSSSCTLSEIPAETGGISCTSPPVVGATASCAGKTCDTPCTLTGIPPGTQTVTYSKSGYDTCTDIVTVIAGETVSSSCTMSPTEVPEILKGWAAENYGDGTCIMSPTGNSIETACLTGTVAPLPAGYTTADVCSETFITWCRDNVGWCRPGPPPGCALVHIMEPIDVETGEPLKGKIYVDEEYIHHYTPRDLIFGPGENCGTPTYPVPCELGTHTIKIDITGYPIWEQTVTLREGDEVTLEPRLTKVPMIEVIAGLTGKITSLTMPLESDPGEVITVTATVTGDEEVTSDMRIKVTIAGTAYESPYKPCTAKHSAVHTVNITSPTAPGSYWVVIDAQATVQELEPKVVDSVGRTLRVGLAPPTELYIDAPHTVPKTVALGAEATLGIGVTNPKDIDETCYIVLEEISREDPTIIYTQTSSNVLVEAGMHVKIPVTWAVAVDTPVGVYEIYATLWALGLGKLGKFRLGTLSLEGIGKKKALGKPRESPKEVLKPTGIIPPWRSFITRVFFDILGGKE